MRFWGLLIAALPLAACNMPGAPTADSRPQTSQTTAAAAIYKPDPAVEARLAAYDAAIRLSTSRGTRLKAMFDKARTQWFAGQLEPALATYDDLVREAADSTDVAERRFAASALVNHGQINKRLQRHDQALADYDRVIRLFFGEADTGMRRIVISAHVFRAEEFVRQQAWDRLDELGLPITALCGETDLTIEKSCSRAMLLRAEGQRRRQQYRQAIDDYGDLETRFAAAVDPTIRSTLLESRTFRGIILQESLRQPDKAMAAYDAAIAMTTSNVVLRDRLLRASAMLNRGKLLEPTARVAAQQQYEQLVAEYEKDTFPALVYVANKGLLNIGNLLMTGGRAEDSLPFLQRAQNRAAQQKGLLFEQQVLGARAGRAQALIRLGRQDEAIAELDAIVKTFSASGESTLREAAARASLAKAELLELQQKRSSLRDALNGFDTRLQATDAMPEPERGTAASGILLAKALILTAIGYHGEAAEASGLVISRYRDRSETKIRTTVATAWQLRAMALHQQGNSLEAAATLHEMIGFFRTAPEPDIRAKVEAAEHWLEQNRQFDTIG